MNNTSYGQTLLRRYLALLLGENPVENYRPQWLFGMELDFYFASLNLGVEFQGDQHYLPVFGVSSCISQRARDRNKKYICRDRGVGFISIDAIDLEYTRLIFKLRRALGPHWDRRTNRLRSIKPALRLLNREAIEYRRKLNANFGAMSTRRKGYTRRLAKYEWLKSNGYPCTKPMTKEERRAARAARLVVPVTSHPSKLHACP